MEKRGRQARRGSITVFMALLLSILVSLVWAGIHSVQMAAARTQILCSMDVGLYSLFSEYDRALLQEYDIFALDASAGDSLLDMAMLLDEFKKYALPVLKQNSQRLMLTQCGFSGYALLTDEEGGVFFRQVVQYMKETLGAQGVMALQGRLRSYQANTAAAQRAGEAVENGRTQENYDAELDQAARRSQEEAERRKAAAQQGSGDFSSGETPGQEGGGTGETVVNPIPMIRRIRQMGILGLVIPNHLGISDKNITNESFFVSKRNVQKGMMMKGWFQEENSFYADALFQQYIMKKLGDYLHPRTYGLNYQLEYVVGGETSDRGNLEIVANRLLLIREGVNAAAIAADPVKMGQLSALSLGIASSFLIPPAASVIQAALLGAWAYAESVLDVRELFSGGRVPLIKSPAQWQLSLENLPNLLGRLDVDRKTDPAGLSYEDYLQVLLITKSRKEKTLRTMDMVEQSLREQPRWQVFRLDSCVVAIMASMEVTANFKKVHTVDRMYGYN